MQINSKLNSKPYDYLYKVGKLICHVLVTVQNTHRRALLFINKKQFIGFLHKQAASTDINLLSLIGP